MAELIDLPFGLWTLMGRRKQSSVVFARWRQCALIGWHNGATWRIRLNRASAAAMRPYGKLLWPFMLLLGCITALARCGLLLQTEYLGLSVGLPYKSS